MTGTPDNLDLGRYKLGWSDIEDYVYTPKKGLNDEIVREMSWMKGEPDWILDLRLRSLRHFEQRPMPNWGGDMSEIDFVSSARQGDLIEMGLRATAFGRTSLTMRAEVRNMLTKQRILAIDRIVFVGMDAEGRPQPHGHTAITYDRDRLPHA